MTDGKAQAEPTMEEILASIRRIISEDEQGGEKPAPVETKAAPAAVTPEAAASDDVLELTEVVNADGSVSSLKDEPADEPEPLLEPEPLPEPSFEPEPEPEAPAFARPPREAPSPPPPPRDFFSDTPADDLGLLSQQAASSATAAFAGLLGSVSGQRGVHLGDGAKTLEDIVKELLRPMLKDWLDRNLPGMVERLVAREISKIAGRAEQD